MHSFENKNMHKTQPDWHAKTNGTKQRNMLQIPKAFFQGRLKNDKHG